jgi:hypothetical protein
MADPLSITASVAGLVTLGSQVCNGVNQYLDAIKCRKEEIDAAKQHIQTLQDLIQIIHNLPHPGFQSQHTFQAISKCLRSCEDDLNRRGELITKISNDDSTGYTFIDRVRERKKKWAYAFDRNKLNQLENRLSNSVNFLQTALQILGM